ncbi:MAG TPA: DUF4360 domain-containing protein [Bdellovibrionales bacterium]|nr:DUF4360 domain-containing protein [Bdellovibrionales bacterium]
MRVLFLLLFLMAAVPAQALAQTGDDAEDFEVAKNPPPVSENADSEWANGMSIGQPSYGGTGCPGGTASAILSPDRKTLSMLFDQFIAEAGNPSGLRNSVKNCQLQIPVHVPAGYRVQVVRMDYRGYNLVPARGKTSYSALYTFNEKKAAKALTKRVRRQRIFNGPLNDVYTLVGRVRGQHWSKCGEDFTLYVHSQVQAVTNNQMEQTMATVDSLDASGTDELKYHLRWKSCRNERPGRPDRPGRGNGRS